MYFSNEGYASFCLLTFGGGSTPLLGGWSPLFVFLSPLFAFLDSTFGVLGVHFLFRGVHSVSTKLPTCIILHNFASQPGENGALLLTLKSFLASA